jgi:cation diffusion facilitator CzcD-associated flavoprotein CzcO
MTISASRPAVVIGAGPYGLSIAAHLRARGVPVRVFGEVMTTWQRHMPAGMFLKSTPAASSLSAPSAGFTLGEFCAQAGLRPLGEHEMVPVGLFIRYGQWFAERLVPGIEPRRVCQVQHAAGSFRLRLDTGEEVMSDAVVLAAGLTDFAYLPPELAAAGPAGPLPASAVSHSSQHRDLSVFAGQDVAVIGAGQSALESAALLHEAGATVRVLARQQARFGSPPKTPARGPMRLLPRPRSPLGPTWRIYPFSHAPWLFRHLPPRTRIRLVRRVLGPLGAWWLADRVAGRLPVSCGQRVLAARRDGDKVLLTVVSADGQQAEARFDHVLAATGYRVDLARLAYLGPELRAGIRTVDGWPDLSSCFESSVPGLFFAGLTAAATFGPVMRFVCGTGFAARRVTAAIAGRTDRTQRAGQPSPAGHAGHAGQEGERDSDADFSHTAR